MLEKYIFLRLFLTKHHFFVIFATDSDIKTKIMLNT